jgi:trimeric autotransporter adhesin
VGGTGMTNNLSNPLSWNTLQNGTGVLRDLVTPQNTDILIIDGSNIGGAVPTTGQITVNTTGNTFGQLILQNNASLKMTRSGGTTGTIVIEGDGTAAPDLVVNSGCTLLIENALADGNIVINIPSTATGLVNGTVTILGTGTHRITSQSLNGLVFAAGSTFTSGGTPSTAAYPFGSSTQGVQNGVEFMAGANLIITGNRSPFGGTSTFQSCNMMPGSNTYFRASNAASTGSWTNLKTLGNLFIQNNTTLTSDGPLYKVDTLRIDAGSTFISHTSGSTPVLGNLIVNGTYTTTGASTNTLVLGGSVPQTVSGTGTMTVNNLVVGNQSDVTLARSIPVTASTNVYGKVNFGTSQITGAGTFSTKNYAADPYAATMTTITGNMVAGSYQITGTSTAPTSITGLKVSGTGLAPNTSVVGFSGTNLIINLSKPATTTQTGVTLTFSSDSATLVTTNPNGFSATGSIASTGVLSYNNGTSVEVNAATTSPYPVPTTPSTYYLTLGNVTFNAPVTTNANVRVRGALTLANGITTIRPLDTIRVTLQPQVLGAPFSNTKYFATANDGTDVGFLRLDGITTPTLFPVGTTTNYLPVTLAPTATNSFAVNAFQGLTENGTVNGTPVTATIAGESVNNTWTINRVGGATDPCAVTLSWPASLEGTAFAAIPDGEVTISRYNGAIYQVPLGCVGDNTLNTATATIGGFSPFIITRNPNGLPVTFISVEAKAEANNNIIKWNVADEYDLIKYTIESSVDGITFNKVGEVNAVRNNQYSFVDASTTNTTYYRVAAIGFNGYKKLSNVLVVRRNGKSTIAVFPSPFTNNITIAGQSGVSVIRIIATNGTIVKKVTTTAGTISIATTELVKGVYSVEVINDKGQKTTKTVIKL